MDRNREVNMYLYTWYDAVIDMNKREIDYLITEYWYGTLILKHVKDVIMWITVKHEYVAIDMNEMINMND